MHLTRRVGSCSLEYFRDDNDESTQVNTICRVPIERVHAADVVGRLDEDEFEGFERAFDVVQE